MAKTIQNVTICVSHAPSQIINNVIEMWMRKFVVL